MEIKNQVIDRVDNPNIVAEVSKIAAAGWFYAICSKSEIERIKDPQNGDDFILLLRADIIADNMRLYRVVKHYVDIAVRSGVEWSLEEFYKTDHFEYFKNHLPVDLKEMVDGGWHSHRSYIYKRSKWFDFQNRFWVLFRIKRIIVLFYKVLFLSSD